MVAMPSREGAVGDAQTGGVGQGGRVVCANDRACGACADERFDVARHAAPSVAVGS